MTLPRKDKERNKLAADVARGIIFGIRVWHIAEVVILGGVVVDVDDGVGKGLGIDGCADGGTVPIGEWLGGGFLLRSRDGGDLNGGCCGG